MESYDRERAESVVRELAKVVNVDRADIDDYKIHRESDYIDFQAVVSLKVHKSCRGTYLPDANWSNFNLRKTSAQIRKILKNNSNVMNFGRAVDCPERVYSWDGFTKQFEGYNKYYIMVDFCMAI